MPTSTRPAAERGLRLAVAPITNITVRDASATGDGSWTIEGYAAVYEQETVLYDSSWMRMREVIARGAFTRVLGTQPLVHLNHGHDMTSAIAASNVDGIGGLQLEEDFHGLRFYARVDPQDPDAVRLAAKMRRGVVAQASFAFTINDEQLAESQTLPDGRTDDLYRILEIGQLFDVCACAQGAYPSTESHLRNLMGASLRTSGGAVPSRRRAARMPVGAMDGQDIAEVGGPSMTDAEDAAEADESLAEDLADAAAALLDLAAEYGSDLAAVAVQEPGEPESTVLEETLELVGYLVDMQNAQSGGDATLASRLSVARRQATDGRRGGSHVATEGPAGLEAGVVDPERQRALAALRARARTARFTYPVQEGRG